MLPITTFLPWKSGKSLFMISFLPSMPCFLPFALTNGKEISFVHLHQFGSISCQVYHIKLTALLFLSLHTKFQLKRSSFVAVMAFVWARGDWRQWWEDYIVPLLWCWQLLTTINKKMSRGRPQVALKWYPHHVKKQSTQASLLPFATIKQDHILATSFSWDTTSSALSWVGISGVHQRIQVEIIDLTSPQEPHQPHHKQAVDHVLDELFQ